MRSFSTLSMAVLLSLLGGGYAAAQEPAKPPAARSAQEEAGEPRAQVSPAPSAPAPAAGAPAPAHPARAAADSRKPPASAADRLELGLATVTGDREQPKVMYVVPWKKADIGDLSGKPMNSLLDEALAPVDRDEFKREVLYYDAMNRDAAQHGAPRQPAQGEK